MLRWLQMDKISMYLTARLLRSGMIYEPLLPASAIASLFCVAVSKTPPIDVIEPEVEPRRRLCPYRPLEPGLWGESLCGKGY